MQSVNADKYSSRSIAKGKVAVYLNDLALTPQYIAKPMIIALRPQSKLSSVKCTLELVKPYQRA
jgi:hypothetical protein